MAEGENSPHDHRGLIRSFVQASQDWTSARYDAIGRVLKTQKFKNASATGIIAFVASFMFLSSLYFLGGMKAISGFAFLKQALGVSGCFGLGICVLAFADQVQLFRAKQRQHVQRAASGQAEEKPKSSFAQILELAVRRPFVIAGVAVTTFGSVLVFGSALDRLYGVQFLSGLSDSVVTIRTNSDRIEYIKIVHPFGWQNTRIGLRKGQQFEVAIEGRVTPGLRMPGAAAIVEQRIRDVGAVDETQKTVHLTIQGVDIQIPGGIAEAVDEYTDQSWPVSGPSGYTHELYANADEALQGNPWYDKSAPRYRERLDAYFKTFPEHIERLEENGFERDHFVGYEIDRGLTIMGLPHNKVVGTVLPPSSHDRPRSANKADQTVLQNSLVDPNRKPGYDWYEPSHREKLVVLSTKSEGVAERRTSPDDGELWVVINDTDEFRMDNGGCYLMRITVTTDR